MTRVYSEKNLNAWGVPVEDEVLDDDNDSAHRKQVSILMIGRSGSGKSALSRSIIKAYNERMEFEDSEAVVYAVNDKTRNCPYTKISWEQMGLVSNCAIVVEDVIHAKDDQVAKLQNLLNYCQHHNNVSPVIMVAHTLTGNNIFSLLPSFHYVFVSAVKSSRRSLSKLLDECGFEPDEKKIYLEVLSNCTEKFCHMRIDVDKHTVVLTKMGQQEELFLSEQEKSAAASKRPDLRLNAAKILADLPESKKALHLFEHIHPKLPKNKLDPSNLNVSLRNAKGEEVQLSLIDYLAALTMADAEPDQTVLKFHAYLKAKGVHFPKFFVLNKRFWDRPTR